MSGSAPAPVVGVLAASGGLGASTLTCALAGRWARRGRTAVCIETDHYAGHLDVTACLEHRSGLRWCDLSQVSGQVDGARLLGALPQEDGVAVLSGAGDSPAPGLLVSVVEALRGSAGLVVLDVARSQGVIEQVAPVCDLLVVLCGLSVRRLADADTVVRRLPRGCVEVALVTRGETRRDELSEAVAAHLDLPLLGRWRDDPRLGTDADRGTAPGLHWRSRQVTLLDRVFDTVGHGAPCPAPVRHASRGQRAGHAS